MKYRVHVPPPRARRMAGRGVVQVVITSGFDGEAHRTDHPVPDAPCIFDFEVPDEVPHLYQAPGCDSDWFDVLVRYTNEAGTREELIRLVPEVVR